MGRPHVGRTALFSLIVSKKVGGTKRERGREREISWPEDTNWEWAELDPKPGSPASQRACSSVMAAELHSSFIRSFIHSFIRSSIPVTVTVAGTEDGMVRIA